MIEYCNYGGCDEIGTEPFLHRFLCKKHKKEMPKDLPGIPMPYPQDRKHHLCSYSGCRAYAVHQILVEEKNAENSLFGGEAIKEVCALHIFTPFISSFGQIKKSRHMEQTRESKKEEKRIEKNMEIADEKTESILFGD